MVRFGKKSKKIKKFAIQTGKYTAIAGRQTAKAIKEADKGLQKLKNRRIENRERQLKDLRVKVDIEKQKSQLEAIRRKRLKQMSLF